MTSMFLLLSAFLALLHVASATLGVDVSQSTSVSSFQCLKSSGYSFAVVRVFQSNGVADPNGPTTIANAWAGGMDHVDGYIFPCYSCGNPSGQIQTAVNNLKNHGTKYGMLWLDIEGTQYWSSNTSNNVNFIQAMVNELNALGVHFGIYTSKSQWTPIAGGSTAFKTYPLWYPHYESPANPSYSDWVPFGGWTTPAVKQYAGTTSICSASVDKNYY